MNGNGLIIDHEKNMTYNPGKNGAKSGRRNWRHSIRNSLWPYPRGGSMKLRSFFARRSRLSIFVKIILGGVALMFVVYASLYVWYGMEYQKSYCDPYMLVTNVVPDSFEKGTFETIKKRAMDIKFSQDKNNLSEDLFKDTSGIVLKFNKDGLSILEQHEFFQVVQPFFDASVSPQSNTYVLNVLIAKPTGVNAETQVVGEHVDDTVAMANMPKNVDYVAYRVNVLYLQVPPNMQGGEIIVNAVPGDSYKKMKIKPSENMLVQFRGDHLHQVKNFESAIKDGSMAGNRVSLVLEEYKIPPRQYPNTFVLCVNDDCVDENQSRDKMLADFKLLFNGQKPDKVW